MEFLANWITYPSHATTARAYLAQPARVTTALPAIIIIQEVWGVDEHLQDLARRIAAAGYLAVAPDLYAHGGERPDVLHTSRVAIVKRHLDAAPSAAWSDPAAREAAFSDLPADERANALETAAALLNPDRPIARYVGDLVALVEHVRSRPDCTGRVGSVGYCLGGMLSALLAAGAPELGGAVIYYGSSPDIATMQPVRCPLLGFYGAEDVRITSGVGAFGDALRANGKSFEAHIYPATPHAFFNDTRPSYRVDAARDAWARTLIFFDAQLTDGYD